VRIQALIGYELGRMAFALLSPRIFKAGMMVRLVWYLKQFRTQIQSLMFDIV